jgi:hypothetical protein
MSLNFDVVIGEPYGKANITHTLYGKPGGVWQTSWGSSTQHRGGRLAYLYSMELGITLQTSGDDGEAVRKCKSDNECHSLFLKLLAKVKPEELVQLLVSVSFVRHNEGIVAGKASKVAEFRKLLEIDDG